MNTPAGPAGRGHTQPPRQSTDVQALVLAGGQSRRMGQDKAWVSWRGQTLLHHVVDTLRAQQPFAPHEIWLSAPQHDPRHPALGFAAVIPDDSAHVGAGPLAGMLAGLQRCKSPWLLVVPCDTPCLPKDLLHQLARAVDEQHLVAVAATTTPQGPRVHPVVALIHGSCAPVIAEQLERGERRLMHWLRRQAHRQVLFEAAFAFANVNDADSLRQLG
jgi:molybdenum cofactor guanylyltransferase